MMNTVKWRMESLLLLLFLVTSAFSRINSAFRLPPTPPRTFGDSSITSIITREPMPLSAISETKYNRQWQDSDSYNNFNDSDDDDVDENVGEISRPHSWDNADISEGGRSREVQLPGSESIRSDQTEHFYSKKSLTDPIFYQTKGDRALFPNLCRGAGITKPSKIQSLAWPILQGGQNAILAEQTGSGKTLAYLIPLVQRALITKEEERGTFPSKASAKKALYGAPSVIILTPTAELADQTKTVCDRLSQGVPFTTLVVTATGKYSTSIRDQIRLLQRQPVDVLISTPGRLATILRSPGAGGLDLSRLQSIVLDEVDVLLLDETFGPQLRTLGAVAPVQRTQFVFCTATLPDSVIETVQREFPTVQTIKGPGLHRVALTVKERLIDVSVPSRYNRDTELCFDVKARELVKVLRQTRCRRTLVFCNTVESCRQVENLLNRRDRRQKLYRVLAYHNAMTPETRRENLDSFSRDASPMDFILVCTDRAARGVDFDSSPVDHVVLFDFPQDPAEYVRRVGRTARAGRTGTSTVFAYGWQLPVARSIMGSKLEYSQSVTPSDMNQYGPEFRGGVKGRRRKGQDQDAASIRTNIEKGTLWNRRDE